MPYSYNPIPRLPWATVIKSYTLTWQYRSEYFRIAWYWLLLFIPVIFVVGLVQPTDSFACMSLDQIQVDKVMDQIMPPVIETILGWLPDICTIIFGGLIAVCWHRLLLRNEQPAAAGSLRLDNRVWSYLAAALVIFFVTAVPKLIITSLPYTTASGISLIAATVMIIVLVVLGCLIARIMVILPAKALGMTEVTVDDVLQRTRNNFWRLTLGALACLLPTVLFQLAAFPFLVMGMIWCSNPLGMRIASTLYITITDLNYLVLGLPFCLSFLSLAYQHFFERPEPATP